MTTPSRPDRRVNKTKESLKKSLYTLLDQMPLDNITISDITKTADVGRSTFYLHYKDIYSLLEDMEKDLVTEYVTNYTTIGFEESYLILCRFIKEHKNFVLAFHTPLQVGVTSILAKKALAKTALDTVYNQCLVEYITAGNNHILNLWIKNNFKESPAEIADILSSFTKHMLILLKDNNHTTATNLPEL